MSSGRNSEHELLGGASLEAEEWISAMGKELNLRFGREEEGDPDQRDAPTEDVQAQPQFNRIDSNISEPDELPDDVDLGGFERQISEDINEHRPLEQRDPTPEELRELEQFAEAEPVEAVAQAAEQPQPARQGLAVPMQARPEEQPKPGSRMQVEYKENGTMVIDPYSVPRTIATAHGAGLDGVRHAVYAPTRHSTDVEGKITAPLQGEDLRQNALGIGATGYLQDYPHMENAVIKRPIAYGEGEDRQFADAASIIHETTILSALGEFEDARGRQNIIQVKGSGVTTDGEPFVIMEHLKGGTLEQRVENEGLPPAQLDQFASGLLAGISFLQNRNVIHQDIKMNNIMFREQGSIEPVIIDFNEASATEGIAAKTDDYHEFQYQRAGEANMQPPEWRREQIDLAKITPKVDSWTGGLCLLAATVGKQNQQQLVLEAKAAGEDQGALDAALDEKLQNAPEHMKQVIKGMMRIDVDERLTAEQALDLIDGEQPLRRDEANAPPAPERVYNDNPKQGSPIRVRPLPNGTLAIEPDSVPIGVKLVQRRQGRGGEEHGNIYGPTEHCLNVNQYVTPPVVDGQHDQPGVLAHGATGVLQDFPHMENSVLKRPNAAVVDPGEPVTFIGIPQIIHEAKILTALSEFEEAKGFENIPKIAGLGITEQNEPYMIMEKLKGGSLADRIPEKEGLPEEKAQAFAEGLLTGLAFLHKRNIVHKDLKPNNIMFRELDGDVPVIIDYDLATAHEGVATGTGEGERDGFDPAGSPDIMPPEIRDPGPNKENLSEKVDAWSAGLLLVTAVAGKAAGDELKKDLEIYTDGTLTDPAQLRELLEGYLRGVPRNMKEAIVGLLKLNPTTRLSAEQALTFIQQDA